VCDQSVKLAVGTGEIPSGGDAREFLRGAITNRGFIV
jgi:hypothetical protein